jgi:plastocyanin
MVRARGASRLPLILALLSLAPANAPRGELRGRVVSALPDVALAQLAPVAVYLEPLESLRDARRARGAAVIRQRDAVFEPGFSIVSAGSEVEVLNDDRIFHNAFSFSPRNAFDLGVYPQGQSRKVALRFPGTVRVYCSIHESMSATILVVPTPYHAVADDAGRFHIPGVVPGRYRAHVWSLTLPEVTRELEIAPGGAAELEIAIGEAASPT